MSSVVARRGLQSGRVSRSFTIHDLADAVLTKLPDCVYVETDTSGCLTANGLTTGAAICASARLAPDATASSALLVPTPSPGEWAVRIVQDVAPHEEVMLWFDEELLRAISMPHLTPNNIRGGESYVCHECGVCFKSPNPLKLHLFLSCADFTPQDFWKRTLPLLHQYQLSNTYPVELERIQYPIYSFPLPPAEIEAIATVWGRASDGHRCVYCGKTYSRKYGLKIHIRTHTGYKPLVCKHCARAFADPSNLNKHLRLHAQHTHETHAVRHACGLCGKSAARRRDLERHLKARHADKCIESSPHTFIDT